MLNRRAFFAALAGLPFVGALKTRPVPPRYLTYAFSQKLTIWNGERLVMTGAYVGPQPDSRVWFTRVLGTDA